MRPTSASAQEPRATPIRLVSLFSVCCRAAYLLGGGRCLACEAGQTMQRYSALAYQLDEEHSELMQFSGTTSETHMARASRKKHYGSTESFGESGRRHLSNSKSNPACFCERGNAKAFTWHEANHEKSQQLFSRLLDPNCVIESNGRSRLLCTWRVGNPALTSALAARSGLHHDHRHQHQLPHLTHPRHQLRGGLGGLAEGLCGSHHDAKPSTTRVFHYQDMWLHKCNAHFFSFGGVVGARSFAR